MKQLIGYLLYDKSTYHFWDGAIFLVIIIGIIFGRISAFLNLPIYVWMPLAFSMGWFSNEIQSMIRKLCNLPDTWEEYIN